MHLTVAELKAKLYEMFQPVQKANLHNVAVVADTNILTSDLSPSEPPCLFRIMVAFNASGTFRAVVTKGGGSQVTNFNTGGALAANALYIFDVLVHSGDTVNLRYSVNATLMVLRIQEIKAGVQ